MSTTQDTHRRMNEIIDQLRLELAAANRSNEELVRTARALGLSAQRSIKMAKILVARNDRLLKEYATVILHVYTSEAQIHEWAAGATRDVVVLVKQGMGLPLGECHRCENIAPLRPAPDADGRMDRWEVCAWGCPEEPSVLDKAMENLAKMNLPIEDMSDELYREIAQVIDREA